MQRLLLTLAAAPLLAVAANAQCFEQNFGVLAPYSAGAAGYGDDVMFDLAPLPFAFPLAGNSATYSHAHISDNGIMYLTNGLAANAPTGPGNGYQTTAVFVGDVPGNDPRVAPLFMDLWSDAANNGGVWINDTIPGKFVVTWQNMVEWWATTQPGNPAVFTFQAQLYANGDVFFYYGPNVAGATYAAQLAVRCGISQANAVLDPGSVDLSLPQTYLTDFILYEEFPVGVFDLADQSIQFVSAGTGFISINSPCTPAVHTNYGQGCYDISDSFYEMLPDASTAPAILDGNSMVMFPAGNQYAVTWGGGVYVPPVGQVNLTLTDDGEVAQALSTPFPVDGGTVNSVFVGANGVVSVAPNAVATTYVPSPNAMLNELVTAWYSHHDYNPTEPGSGPITFFEQGGVAYITWEGVESYSTPVLANQSTLQFQLDSNTGSVAIVWQQIDGDPTSPFGSAHLIGWSSGGPSVDSGSASIAAASPFVTNSTNINALQLNASPAPISTATTGSTIVYTTDNLVAFAPGIYIGMNIVSLTPATVGLPLAFLGAPGCNAYVGTLDLTQAMVGVSSTLTASLALPPGLPLGIRLYSQSIGLVQPNSLPNGQNAFGLITSNGVESYISDF